MAGVLTKCFLAQPSLRRLKRLAIKLSGLGQTVGVFSQKHEGIGTEGVELERLLGQPHLMRPFGLQRLVHQLLSFGLGSVRRGQIADEFGISEETVKKHLATIYGKLALRGRVALAVHVLQTGSM